MVLCQLADKLVAGDMDMNVLSSLYTQFYEALPHKADFVKDSWTVRDVVVKKDFCQVYNLYIYIFEAILKAA